MKKVKYISVYHFCRGQDAEYHVSFNRGEDAAKTPRYNAPTPSSLKRVAKLFYRLEALMPTLTSNYIHLQAFVKGD